MRHRSALAALLILTAAPLARAHDLKVLAARLAAATGETDTVYISHGHTLPVDVPIDGKTLQDYRVLTPSGSVLELTKEGVSLHANEVKVEESGVYTAVAARKPAVYTEYVDKDGNHKHLPGPKSVVSEGTIDHATRSHQFAKALLVSGEASADPAKVLGHEIEIVPVDAPGRWRSGRDLRFRVLFQGKPLSAGDVVATHVGFKPDGAWCYATSTDAKGVAVVRPSQAGTWVLRARVLKPSAKDRQDEYDIESYTATLALEVTP